MAPKTIPRSKIPWFPAVAAERCDGCGKCLDFCPHGVYARAAGSSAVVVRNPYECVVGCSNCESLCPGRAISFPDMGTIAEIIRRLREEAAEDSR